MRGRQPKSFGQNKFCISGFQPIPRDCKDKGHDLCAGGQNKKNPIDNLLFWSTSAANMT